MSGALGMIEVKGFVAAIEIADLMAKVSNINILEMKKTRGFGWMVVLIEGDVGAVQAAIQAGESQARQKNFYVTSKVIPRSANKVKETMIQVKPEKKAETTEELPKKNVSSIPIEEVQMKDESSVEKVTSPQKIQSAQKTVKEKATKRSAQKKAVENVKKKEEEPVTVPTEKKIIQEI